MTTKKKSVKKVAQKKLSKKPVEDGEIVKVFEPLDKTTLFTDFRSDTEEKAIMEDMYEELSKEVEEEQTKEKQKKLQALQRKIKMNISYNNEININFDIECSLYNLNEMMETLKDSINNISKFKTKEDVEKEIN